MLNLEGKGRERERLVGTGESNFMYRMFLCILLWFQSTQHVHNWMRLLSEGTTTGHMLS